MCKINALKSFRHFFGFESIKVFKRATKLGNLRSSYQTKFDLFSDESARKYEMFTRDDDLSTTSLMHRKILARIFKQELKKSVNIICGELSHLRTHTL